MKNKIDQLKKLMILRADMANSPGGDDNPQVCQLWEEMIKILSKDIYTLTDILNSLNEDEISWLIEVFDDIAKKLKDKRVIGILEEQQIKYPAIDMRQDIEYAKKYFV